MAAVLGPAQQVRRGLGVVGVSDDEHLERAVGLAAHRLQVHLLQEAPDVRQLHGTLPESTSTSTSRVPAGTRTAASDPQAGKTGAAAVRPCVSVASAASVST